ncbi:hypothetical protein BaRGS_00022116 [Batillaria attramentaria]|uniref:Uncharacterized protein n=1 Tax=Batillaria attramentaria TaxID=370345 RepID=A0ABD0KI29_9CAEN
MDTDSDEDDFFHTISDTLREKKLRGLSSQLNHSQALGSQRAVVPKTKNSGFQKSGALVSKDGGRGRGGVTRSTAPVRSGASVSDSSSASDKPLMISLVGNKRKHSDSKPAGSDDRATLSGEETTVQETTSCVETVSETDFGSDGEVAVRTVTSAAISEAARRDSVSVRTTCCTEELSSTDPDDEDSYDSEDWRFSRQYKPESTSSRTGQAGTGGKREPLRTGNNNHHVNSAKDTSVGAPLPQEAAALIDWQGSESSHLEIEREDELLLPTVKAPKRRRFSNVSRLNTSDSEKKPYQGPRKRYATTQKHSKLSYSRESSSSEADIESADSDAAAEAETHRRPVHEMCAEPVGSKQVEDDDDTLEHSQSQMSPNLFDPVEQVRGKYGDAVHPSGSSGQSDSQQKDNSDKPARIRSRSVSQESCNSSDTVDPDTEPAVVPAHLTSADSDATQPYMFSDEEDTQVPPSLLSVPSVPSIIKKQESGQSLPPPSLTKITSSVISDSSSSSTSASASKWPELSRAARALNRLGSGSEPETLSVAGKTVAEKTGARACNSVAESAGDDEPDENSCEAMQSQPLFDELPVQKPQSLDSEIIPNVLHTDRGLLPTAAEKDSTPTPPASDSKRTSEGCVGSTVSEAVTDSRPCYTQEEDAVMVFDSDEEEMFSSFTQVQVKKEMFSDEEDSRWSDDTGETHEEDDGDDAEGDIAGKKDDRDNPEDDDIKMLSDDDDDLIMASAEVEKRNKHYSESVHGVSSVFDVPTLTDDEPLLLSEEEDEKDKQPLRSADYARSAYDTPTLVDDDLVQKSDEEDEKDKHSDAETASAYDLPTLVDDSSGATDADPDDDPYLLSTLIDEDGSWDNDTAAEVKNAEKKEKAKTETATTDATSTERTDKQGRLLGQGEEQTKEKTAEVDDLDDGMDDDLYMAATQVDSPDAASPTRTDSVDLPLEPEQERKNRVDVDQAEQDSMPRKKKQTARKTLRFRSKQVFANLVVKSEWLKTHRSISLKALARTGDTAATIDLTQDSDAEESAVTEKHSPPAAVVVGDAKPRQAEEASKTTQDLINGRDTDHISNAKPAETEAGPKHTRRQSNSRDGELRKDAKPAETSSRYRRRRSSSGDSDLLSAEEPAEHETTSKRRHHRSSSTESDLFVDAKHAETNTPSKRTRHRSSSGDSDLFDDAKPKHAETEAVKKNRRHCSSSGDDNPLGDVLSEKSESTSKQRCDRSQSGHNEFLLPTEDISRNRELEDPDENDFDPYMAATQLDEDPYMAMTQVDMELLSDSDGNRDETNDIRDDDKDEGVEPVEKNDESKDDDVDMKDGVYGQSDKSGGSVSAEKASAVEQITPVRISSNEGDINTGSGKTFENARQKLAAIGQRMRVTKTIEIDPRPENRRRGKHRGLQQKLCNAEPQPAQIVDPKPPSSSKPAVQLPGRKRRRNSSEAIVPGISEARRQMEERSKRAIVNPIAAGVNWRRKSAQVVVPDADTDVELPSTQEVSKDRRGTLKERDPRQGSLSAKARPSAEHKQRTAPGESSERFAHRHHDDESKGRHIAGSSQKHKAGDKSRQERGHGEHGNVDRLTGSRGHNSSKVQHKGAPSKPQEGKDGSTKHSTSSNTSHQNKIGTAASSSSGAAKQAHFSGRSGLGGAGNGLLQQEYEARKKRQPAHKERSSSVDSPQPPEDSFSRSRALGSHAYPPNPRGPSGVRDAGEFSRNTPHLTAVASKGKPEEPLHRQPAHSGFPAGRQQREESPRPGIGGREHSNVVSPTGRHRRASQESERPGVSGIGGSVDLTTSRKRHASQGSQIPGILTSSSAKDPRLRTAQKSVRFDIPEQVPATSLPSSVLLQKRPAPLQERQQVAARGPPSMSLQPADPQTLLQEDDLLTRLLKWSPMWLEEYERAVAGNSPNSLPPVVDKSRVYPLVTTYEDIGEYQQICFTLMLLELWEEIFRSWKERKAKPQPCQVVFTDTIRCKNMEQIMFCWKGLLTQEQYRRKLYPVEGDVVSIRMFGVNLLQGSAAVKSGQTQPPETWIEQFAFVERSDVQECRNRHELSNKWPQLGNHPAFAAPMGDLFVLNVTLKLRYRKFAPTSREIVTLWNLGSVVSAMRRFHALRALPRSLLMRDILKPTRHVYHHQYPKTNQPVLMTGENNFNEKQIQVIKSVAAAMLQPFNLPRICLLQGPPGTGKSHVIVGLVLRILQESQNKARICLAAPSNAAADELLKLSALRIGSCSSAELKDYLWERVVEKEKNEEISRRKLQNVPKSVELEYRRIQTRIQDTMVKINLHQKKENLKQKEQCQRELADLKKKQAQFKKSLISGQREITLTSAEASMITEKVLLDANIVCGTLNSFGSSRIVNILRRKLREQNRYQSHFTCAIIDEATQATELDCLIPLQFGMTKLVLVGDPNQLPPTVLSMKAQSMNYGLSLFERLYNHFKDEGEKGVTDAVMMLDTQYRMDPAICQFPNSYIYSGLLHTPRQIKENCLRFALQPYRLFDIEDGQEKLSQSGSLCNELEAECTAVLCEELLKMGASFHTNNIGIICPYASQKRLVCKRLCERGLSNIEVNTVDGFQGREKHIIILSCVRARSTTGGIGFMADRRRMNVALTRAKYALYIIGHLQSLRTDRDWKELIHDAERKERQVALKVPSLEAFPDIIRRHCFKPEVLQKLEGKKRLLQSQ